MLKKKLLKKIAVIVASLIVVEIIILFPKENSYTLKGEGNNTGIIYLLDDNNYVSRLEIIYDSTTTKGLIKEMIDILTINNSKTLKIRDGFSALIPENTKLLNYNVKDAVVSLNFSKEILNVDEKLEEKMIEAIVYSLTSLKDIESVAIKVEDKPLEKLPHSTKKLPSIIDRTFKINKEYDLKTLNNIKETTIFYLAKKDDYIYYIPVTKYTNSNKEKIEIIIDELKSSSTYNTNLISYINEETQLINHELLDKSLILNFNNQILNDINSNNIIEEVTYAINLSVKESYNVENVMYYVDDSIIENYFLLRG